MLKFLIHLPDRLQNTLCVVQKLIRSQNANLEESLRQKSNEILENSILLVESFEALKRKEVLYHNLYIYFRITVVPGLPEYLGLP